MNNSFEGPMPNMAKLGSLNTLYLSHNRFSDEIKDDAFDGMKSLKKVYLARNKFMGKIPKSLAALPKLMELNLEVFYLADKQLEGRIPKSLSQMNSSSFVGNKDPCGLPLDPCKSSRKNYIVIIIILAIAVVALAAMGVFLYKRGRRLQKTKSKMAQEIKAYKNSGGAAEAYDVDRKEAQSPDLPGEYEKDLLRASAEVLGSESFGSSYKAVLLSGPAMVVKRFRQMNKVGKGEFHDHMRRLGSLSHPNVLPLVAFYYTKEEKLLISDLVQNGSLACHLHARRAPGQPGLDWPTRLKIIKGVARGLAYLHREFPNLILPHGHLESSNVLLDHTFMPLLSDFALVPVVNKEHAQQYMAAYKSPEFTQRDRTAQKTDVWCLGILILELLTGKFPVNYLKHGNGANADLASWVNSVVREEWTGEVFDIDMKGAKNSEEEMLKLLKIGMCCCEWDVDRRWELREALEKIEDLKERDNEDDNYSSNVSEGDMYSSRGMT
ncbi:hypothetical protein I3842_07G212600 [Carya illinoinensis]|uniref:Protein kinase domain-containing protein n=1 Tax=Carya illinoinensis TaxID=32201 RepID=A0A922EQL2_CARIL|nr:hypothetical protein I3842_07G212600 [Carya illinoinensis]